MENWRYWHLESTQTKTTLDFNTGNPSNQSKKHELRPLTLWDYN